MTRVRQSRFKPGDVWAPNTIVAQNDNSQDDVYGGYDGGGTIGDAGNNDGHPRQGNDKVEGYDGVDDDDDDEDAGDKDENNGAVGSGENNNDDGNDAAEHDDDDGQGSPRYTRFHSHNEKTCECMKYFVCVLSGA